MSRERQVAERVASLPGVDVESEFLRHAAPGRDPFAGGYGGRWGDGFPVIYVGRPIESCVEEAYRHLVDESGVPAHLVKSRILYRVRVSAHQVLDLTAQSARETVGLADADIYSEVGDYDACQRVAEAAHQLEYHGILAPAATGMGSTLALFGQRIGVLERPTVIDQSTWQTLPARPGDERARLTVMRSPN